MEFYRDLRLIVILAATVFLLSTAVIAVEPFGAITSQVGSPERAPTDAPDTEVAFAGNITEFNLEGFTVTQSWQGYFGNVSGTIVLADNNDFQMYNWSLADPEGEVYMANQTVTWTNIQCFNYTATGTFASDAAQRGATSLFGYNLTRIEILWGINASDVDGVDETFNLLGAGTHDLFYTNNLQFDIGECRNTRLFDTTGQGVNNNFEEALLYDPDGRVVVFTSILDQNQAGFDTATHDFQGIVLEDGHGTDVVTTTYYFYVELS
jgi:hypothetical protein